jgi:signal transduction histidine kinase
VEKNKTKFSIRYKFLAVTSLLLTSCVALYLYLAATIFKTDKQELVFDLNRSMVTNISSELETQFASLSDKVELFAMMGFQKNLKRELIETILEKNREVVFVSFWKQTEASTESNTFDKTYLQADFLKTYGLDKTYFTEKLFTERKLNLKVMLGQGEDIWNATLPNGPPLFGYARSVLIEDEKGRPIDRVAVVAFVNAEKILKTISSVELSQIYIVSKDGEILVHRDPLKMSQMAKASQSLIYQNALESPLKTGVVQTQNEKEEVLGAFSKIAGGKVFILAESSGSKAFAVVRDLIRRSLIFSLIILTVAFMAAVLFSKSLTRPLESLTAAMNRVSEGDLDTQIHLKTRDEIEFLANSFNSMIEDLKESRQELEAINLDLENKVKERTFQLEKQNQAIKEAQEALLKTTRLAAVGEIAGRAAHEVLNPLTSLMTRLENVQKRLGDQKKSQLQFFEEIRKAWETDHKEGGFELLIKNWAKPSTVQPGMNLWQEDIGNLAATSDAWKVEIDGLLKDSQFLMNESQRISKIVGSMRSLSVVRTTHETESVMDLLTKCHDIMADLMDRYLIKFEVDAVHPLVKVRIDRDEFIQSITNLLRNSQQAVAAAQLERGDHRGYIRIRTEFLESGGLLLLLEDNGVGISSEDKDKLFETQFSTKSRDEGTGLGLSITRRFLRAAGGDIELQESEPYVRTVFRIQLPIVQAQEVAA